MVRTLRMCVRSREQIHECEHVCATVHACVMLLKAATEHINNSYNYAQKNQNINL